MPVPAITGHIKKYGVKTLVAKVAFKVMNKKAELIYKKIKDDLNEKKIIDIGTGIGSISNILLSHNYKVTSIDVTNLNIYKDVNELCMTVSIYLMEIKHSMQRLLSMCFTTVAIKKKC